MSEERFLKKEDILESVNAFKESRVLLTAVELNVFSILDTHMMTIDQIVTKTRTDKRATERLLSALVGMGLIRKLKEKYYNTDISKTLLNKKSSSYLGMIDHANNLWGSWSTLTQAVKKGSSVILDKIDDRPQEWRSNFIAAMHSRGIYQAEMISYMIDFTNVETLLDIGGGSGAFTFAFLNKNEKMKAKIFDLPNIVPITKEYVELSEVENRIEIITGDYNIDVFPDSIDMILLSAIIHINSYDENKVLIERCCNSLNPGGKIVILDYVMNEDRTTPYKGALFALNMLVGTLSGDTYTKNEIEEWFQASGIDDVEFKPTSFGNTLVIGRK